MTMDYPEPFIVPPSCLPHKQTFILLHGRGSSGGKFGSVLLDTPISSRTPSRYDQSSPPAPEISALTLASVFPHARFVFPSAPRRRAALYRRAYTHQWFDNWKIDPPATDREYLQVPGLYETTIYLHNLLRAEIAAVPGGASNVILGGLSQGCAASLVALLLWEGETLAAAVGMCGRLPFATQLNEQLFEDNEHDDERFDPFERADEGSEAEHQDQVLDPPTRAINWLREELQVPGTCESSRIPSIMHIPIFLGHGAQDEKVSIILGRQAHNCLTQIGAEVCWREYESLGHWYSGDLLRDFVEFIEEKSDWDHQKRGPDASITSVRSDLLNIDSIALN
ncbi:Fc.00g103490.m01.CDS01 [Cosmosporella sp. VM-42]